MTAPRTNHTEPPTDDQQPDNYTLDLECALYNDIVGGQES